jgi:site-specific DNA-cytosine methylase
MPNISDWPNDAAVCSLSQVLETTSIPQRFFLSSTACAGILRRADKRGKSLPPSLHAALLAVASEQTSVAHTLRVEGFDASEDGTGRGTPLVPCEEMGVRRLTPRECERLQGFPDDYTRISWRGRPAENCPDGPRYKAIGNSMAVPVMAWIGRRIADYIA